MDRVPNYNELDDLSKLQLLEEKPKNYFNRCALIKINRGMIHQLAENQIIYPNKGPPFYLDDNTLIRDSPLEDKSFEYNESVDITIHSGHRMFDLHGFTTLGAEQALRRIFTSVDRSRQQVIKINVGTGSHSQDRIAKLPNVVRKVAEQLQLPMPVKHDKNPGYLLMILPPISSTE
ncbi:hypothetical protein M9Y10_044465 [Tritrichomonas musculus]|uniref:Smr domain-containing protein n=1 Tax=Tritrichomonas musculus TaxID=1915356 RepID=A0ABR2JSW9_9EUKA